MYVFSKDAILGSVPSISSEVLVLYVNFDSTKLLASLPIVVSGSLTPIGVDNLDAPIVAIHR